MPKPKSKAKQMRERATQNESISVSLAYDAAIRLIEVKADASLTEADIRAGAFGKQLTRRLEDSDNEFSVQQVLLNGIPHLRVSW